MFWLSIAAQQLAPKLSDILSTLLFCELIGLSWMVDQLHMISIRALVIWGLAWATKSKTASKRWQKTTDAPPLMMGWLYPDKTIRS